MPQGVKSEIPHACLLTEHLHDAVSVQIGAYHRFLLFPTPTIELPYIRKNVREFIQLMDPLIADAETLQPAELIQLLRSALDYDRT